MKEYGDKKFYKFTDEKLITDNGVKVDVYLPEDPKDRVVYENEYCKFKPVGFVFTDAGWMPLAYKVVTEKMRSLGLRRNPNPMFFPVGEWVFENNELEYGDKDYGGIWSAYRLGNANTLKKYCLEKGMTTKTFLCAVYNPVAFVGNYRIKSEGVILVKEII